MSLTITVIYATRKPWVPSRQHIARWVRATLGRRRGAWDLAVRVVGRAESHRFNRRYRRRNKPTNVLSFPATLRRVDGRRPLGDLIVCAPVVAAEARAQRKSRAAHWAHMIVHGTLHLAGYDHEHSAAAARMERREVAILKAMGISNPYVVVESASGARPQASGTRNSPPARGPMPDARRLF